MKSSYTIPLAIIFGGVIVAGAIYFSLARTPLSSSTSGNAALVRPVGAADHILGNPRAPVMIIEYSDFDCDFCKRFHHTMHQVIANAGANGKVAWVFRQFPLTELEGHENAMKHAQAAECVAKAAGSDSTLFWKFADALYLNQPTDPSRYGALAQEAGVPSEAFSTCYTNAAALVDARINADRENALAAGATGTPYSFIVVAGKAPIVLDGAYTYDALQLILDKVLAEL